MCRDPVDRVFNEVEVPQHNIRGEGPCCGQLVLDVDPEISGLPWRVRGLDCENVDTFVILPWERDPHRPAGY